MNCPFHSLESADCVEGNCALWRPGSAMCAFLVIANVLIHWAATNIEIKTEEK